MNISRFLGHCHTGIHKGAPVAYGWYMHSILLWAGVIVLVSRPFAQPIEISWSRSFYDTSYTTIQQVIKSEQGDYFALLARDYYDSLGTYSYSCVLEKRDGNGDLLKKKTFLDFFGYGRRMVFRSDGGLLLLKGDEIVRLDADLTEERRMGLGASYSVLTQSHDGNFLLAASASGNLTLKKIDATGLEIWKRDLPVSNLGFIAGIRRGRNNDYLLWGTEGLVRTGQDGSLISDTIFSVKNLVVSDDFYFLLSDTVLKLDTALNVLSEVETFAGSSGRYAGIALNKGVMVSDGRSLAYIDSSDSTQWNVFFPEYEFHGAIGIFATAQGWDLFTLYHEGNDPTWMLSQMRDTTSVTALRETEPGFLNVVFGSFSHAATVHFRTPPGQRSSLSVYNASGRLMRQIYQDATESGDHAVYLPKSGLYLAKLTVDGNHFHGKILVRH